jgi:hypothetical protein
MGVGVSVEQSRQLEARMSAVHALDADFILNYVHFAVNA